jgi:hypothetical protein
MSGLNRYYRRSRISEKKFRLLLRYFAMDLNASQTAVLADISRRTTNSIFLKIGCDCSPPAKPFRLSPVRKSKVDESYFGARRVKGKRGRGASGKQIVLGIYKRNGFVFTEIVPDVQKKTLQAIISGRAALDSIIHSDGCAAATDWLIQAFTNIIASIIQRMSLCLAIRTLTGLKVSGHMPKEDYTNSSKEFVFHILSLFYNSP